MEKKKFVCQLSEINTDSIVLNQRQVRNLCYMVSRREKLKLLQSKAQEQMFNLHVKLTNQELSAGEPPVIPSRLPVLCLCGLHRS